MILTVVEILSITSTKPMHASLDRRYEGYATTGGAQASTFRCHYPHVLKPTHHLEG